eukprot:CAMPEP_0196821874 /NCGR_PEP_ID=MMETSP1362-20130617/81315_1 /TAXON_ID=163516 /ORGANISM="Leptocylindrus danicus, Strain CCMP1856" /LENGTH=834 /DNA_ID=CAMNT_0042201249 /DNA_START=427 /DNA_END=2931 /DNA_ORIENTATION=-
MKVPNNSSRLLVLYLICCWKANVAQAQGVTSAYHLQYAATTPLTAAPTSSDDLRLPCNAYELQNSPIISQITAKLLIHVNVGSRGEGRAILSNKHNSFANCWNNEYNAGCMYTGQNGDSIMMRISAAQDQHYNESNTGRHSGAAICILGLHIDFNIRENKFATSQRNCILCHEFVDVVEEMNDFLGIATAHGRPTRLSDDVTSSSDNDDSVTARWSIRANSGGHDFDDAASLYGMILSAELPYKHRQASIVTSNDDRSEIWVYESLEGHRVTALFVNDILQTSTEPFTKIHAETMVHPALVNHVQPTQILVVSRYNSLALLQQILKYRSVTCVRVVNADMEVLALTKEYMPELDDCTLLIGISDECSKDDRVSFNAVNASAMTSEIKYSNKNGKIDPNDEQKERVYSKNGTIFERMSEDAHHSYYEAGPDDMTQPGLNQYDVIYIDCCDGSETLDVNDGMDMFGIQFHNWLYSMSTHETMIVMNAGHAPRVDVSVVGRREQFILDQFVGGEVEREEGEEDEDEEEHEQSFDYSVLHIYEEELVRPHHSSFLCIFVGYLTESSSHFFRSNSAGFDFDLLSRLVMRNGELLTQPTIHFDGPVHQRYVRLVRAWETWFCNIDGFDVRFPACSDFLFKFFNPNFHHDETEVRWNADAGRTLVAATDIPKGHFVASNDAVNALFMDSFTWKALITFANDYPSATMYRGLVDMILAYGFEFDNFSRVGWCVSTSSTNTFINHSCNEKEETVHPAYSIFSDIDGSYVGFLPPVMRRPEITGITSVAKRDIMAGEEIRVDYRSFRSDMRYHPSFEEFLSESICKNKHGFVHVDEELPSHLEL